MAVGPQLAGIQTNDGTLLREGQVRKTGPSELTFHFSDGADLNSATVANGIRLLRAGNDGAFERAVATTDFNTSGQVVMDFTAVKPGESGNGIALSFIKNDLGVGVGPRITVQGEAIQVELNSRAGSQTTAAQLRTAINSHAQASQIVTASLRNSVTGSVNIAAPAINYSPVVTGGANAASATSNLNVGGNFQVKLTAQKSGPDGNGIEVVINRADFGGVRPPDITVSGRTITVTVNSNAASPTTAREFVNALNVHAQASSLLRAAVTVGSPDTPIGNRVNSGTRLRLAGTKDVPIEPGFLGLGTSSREVVMRFKEPLPDDLYHVEILGTGTSALRNVNGGAFGDTTEDGADNGVDFHLNFELDLGAQIIAVVPQPITRNAATNALQQARNQIQVYFNNDDLWPAAVSTGQLATNPTVVDPAFYQLIFTNDTVHNQDDVVYRPTSIQYDPASDMAVLQFAQNIEQLGSGAGTFRLRIGTDESAPLAPAATTLSAFGQASTDFGTQGAATVLFQQTAASATPVTVQVTKSDRGVNGLPGVTVAGSSVRIDLNSRVGSESTAAQVVAAVNGSAAASVLVAASLFNTPSPGNVNVATAAATPFTLQLRETGSSFDTALNLSVLGSQGQTLSAAITPQAYQLPFPGAISDPGHRDLPFEVQQHYLQGVAADTAAGVTTAFYNFQEFYGFDPLGTPLQNAITENQKQRAREVFSLYSGYLGIQFIETDNLGMTIATGDLRALDPEVTTGPGGVLGIAGGGLNGTAIMDAQDFSAPGADVYGGAWFQTAMHEIGHLLGLGHTHELPPLTILGDEPQLAFPENTVEPIFPGDNDVLHGQHLYRPDSIDIDLYRFEVRDAGRLTAETIAERLPQTSLLDTTISLYRQEADGSRILVARNDDYFSNDSFVDLELTPAVYWIGVSASGNDQYDPVIEGTGLGGRTEGNYALRLNFRPDADRSIVDATGVELDGDGDGKAGGVFDYWFRAQTASRTIVVDKAATGAGLGTLASPFRTVATALAAARPGDVVRIVGNGGADRNLTTLDDNLAYEIGFNRLGTVLADGASMDVPQGVSVMIDAGAIFKLRRARIGVGSSSEVVDLSAASLQLLGTPNVRDSAGQVLRDVDGNILPGSVYLTSIHDAAIGQDTNPDAQPPAAQPGDWGGIDFRRDVDARDVNRFDYERRGIFLNHISQADLRYGGGTVIVNGLPEVISPINMVSSRPTAVFNQIRFSADAAMSATPDSFEESNFHDPGSQLTPFTADYSRVGPEIHGNTVIGNSINGLFVRVVTAAGEGLRPMTVAGRWDDRDIPHVLTERLVVQGTPGGHLFDNVTPSVQLVTLAAVQGGQLATGNYHYRVVFVDQDGSETAPSNPTASRAIDGNTAVRSIQLNNLPLVPQPFVAKRVYRSDPTGNANLPYSLVAELNPNATTLLDTGVDLGTQTKSLAGALPGLRSRLDARLAIDPGVVVKLNGGAIEATLGADVYAEGVAGREIILTSTNDDRYGAGGTFDTTGNGSTAAASPGDWGGIFLNATSRGSVDHAVIAYGGGTVTIEGGFAGLNALEAHQAELRLAHSHLEHNGSGSDSSNRAGRGFNRPSTVFIRGAQPVILDNEFFDNDGAVISINASALTTRELTDYGRSTYVEAVPRNPIDIVDVARDNQGPLVRLNRLHLNDVNGMQVRGATLTTESVWDDVDIVHVLRNETVNVPDYHTVGGLRLESSATESLVIKLDGVTAGITATGRPLDIDDRIGGSLHVVGQPGKPVVMTSIDDCTVGAGFTPDGEPQNDTVNSFACRPRVAGPEFADVVVLMDESASMFFAQQFSVQMIQDLENALVGAGIGAGASGPNRYGLVGFGGAGAEQPGHAHPVGAGGALFGTAAEYATAALTLTDLGAVEDGYNAIEFALNNYQTRANAAKFMILVTNEDRDIISPQFTFATTLAGLNASGYVLEAIINADINTSTGGVGLAIDDDRNVFVENGTGGFTVSPNGTITPFFDTSVQDYANLAFATGGVAGDISQIQVGGTTATSFSNVLASQIVVQAGGGNPARGGDWRSVRLDQYANDRNVAPLVEAELSGAVSGVGNGTPALAQLLGNLAPHEKAGDENLRLGFEVDGSLADRGDVDVYSFRATAGTEVWLDIDGTRNTLDTVLELVDSNGNVLARSNDSGAEADDPSLLFRSPSMAAGTVNPQRKAGYDPSQPTRASAYELADLKTTNPRDAGMRLVLPGTPGATATYHVRVRSNGPNLNVLNGGLTKGNYRLQVRLRELDEVPGSTVRYADIRYATNGIELLGLPAHSPLLGELAEVEANSQAAGNNNTLASAQSAGNALQMDRGVLSVSGNIDLPSDVDFYQVTVEYESIQGGGPSPHASMIFDIDYTDGLARPNTTMWVFDSEGRLILRGTGSNVSEDRGGPLAGSDSSDLSRGSVGALDPYIGPVELPAGPDILDSNPAVPNRQTYYVAITSNAMTSAVLQQYLTANVPADVAAIRLEPVNSVRRIAEDRIGSSGGSLIAEPPVVPVLIDPTQSMVPFHLGDVTLFVSQQVGLSAGTISTLRTVDPFTGAQETVAGSFPQPISDIAMRGDGNIFAYTIGPNNFNGAIDDASTGTYVQIDSATGATTAFSDDGAETNVDDPMNPGNPVRPNNGAGFGMNYNALVFSGTSNAQFSGFTVGTRRDSSENNDPDLEPAGPDYLENILYNFDINNGVIRNPGGAPDKTAAALLTGAGTNRIEIGEILTYTRITPQNPEVGDTFTITINGKSISYTAVGGLGGFATVQEVVGGLASAWQAAALTIPEFAAFEVMNSGTGGIFGFGPSELRVRLINPAGADLTIQATTTNAGTSLEAVNVDGFGPGGIVTGLAVLGGSFYAVTDRGGLFQLFTGFGGAFSNNIATYVRSSAADLMSADGGQAIAFSGLTNGPPRAEGGRYADMLFGITGDGTLYGFDVDGELQPVFVNNQTSVETGLTAVHGLAFSTLDRNLWTVTNNRGTDQGHGLNLSGNNDQPFDRSRLDTLLGGNSVYFGNDRSASVGGNQAFSNTAFVRDYNFPGGAYGTVISNPFSLKGYAAEDLPVMYFNYFLGTEGTDFNPAPNPDQLTRDTLRVFVSGDEGEWTLVATNDLWQDPLLFDEFDIGLNDQQCTHPAFATEPCVQPLFDNAGWRQARIPLGRFAGRDNLRLRFDFSSAGDMNLGDTFTVGSELRVLAGSELRDGQTMTLDGNRTLEIDLGYTIVAPNGAALTDGNSFTVTSGPGGTRTFEFDSDGFFRRNIAAAAGMLLRDGDTFQVRVGAQTRIFEFDSGPSLHVPAAGALPGGLKDGDSFSIDGIVFEFDADGVVTPGRSIINLNVDGVIRIPAAGAGTGGVNEGDQLVINDGLGGPSVVFEFDRNHPTSVTPGARAVDITNIELLVPVSGGGFGGLRDGDSFVISDGLGSPDSIFEFDKDNSVTGGSIAIFITDQSSQDDIANAIVSALRAANIGLNPVNRGGGAVRLGAFRHSVDTANAVTLGSRFVDANQAEIAARLADSIVGSGLVLTPVVGPQGVIRLGGITQTVDTSNAPSVQYSLLPGTQNEIADLIVAAVTNSPLPEIPVNLGNGEVYLGRLVNLVDTSGAPSLARTGAVGRQNPSAVPVVFSPVENAEAIANAISTAINGSGLGITTTVDQGVVQMPATASFAPLATPLAPAGVQPVPFTTQDSPAEVASSIDQAMQAAFAPVSRTIDLTQEANDRLADAVDAGLTGGPGVFTGQGFIGDNAALGARPGVDVDFVELALKAGERALISVSTTGFQGLTPRLRLFDDQGQQIAASSTSQIDFRAVTTGTYFVAVSSSANASYNPSFAASADLTIRVPAAGGALGGLTDGESFTVAATPASTPMLFEFDNNGVTAPNATSIRISDFVLQVPSAGAGPGGIRDQDSFIVNDNRGTLTRFEFDTDGNTTAGSVPISIFPQFDTAATIAFRIQAALAGANIGLNPSVLGGSSVLLGSTTHTISVAGTPSLTATLRPRTQQEIATLIFDALRVAPLGLRPTRSGAGGILLDITTQVVNTASAPNLALVIPSNTGAYSLRVEVTSPFETHRSGNRVNLVGVTDLTTSGLPSSFVDGRPGVSQAARTPVVIDASFSRSQVAEAVAQGIGRAAGGYAQQMVVSGGADIADGEIFSLGDGVRTVSFEFDSGYSLQLPDLATDSRAYLDGEFFTISHNNVLTTFEFDNEGTTNTGSVALRFNDVTVLVPAGGVTLGGIVDGQSFAIDQGLGTTVTTFEFDTDGAVTPGTVAVRLTPTSNQNDVANAMVLALRQAGIGLSPVNTGQGRVQLGVTNHNLDLSNSPALTQQLVLLSRDQMATKVVNAIAGAGVGLTPSHLGAGLIHLGGTVTHVVDVSRAVRLQLFGSPGPNDPQAIVIPIFPSAATSPASVAQLVFAAVNTAIATRGLNLTSTLSGTRRINLNGNGLVSEFANAPSLTVNNAGDSIKTYDNIVKVIGHTVTNRGPFGLETSLAGDSFGAFNTSGPPNVTQYPGALRGMDNAHEGAYIDDIVIGFAERGEMITGASPNSTFITNQELLNPNLQVGVIPHTEIHVGPYELEVRRGEAFGVTIQEPSPEIILTRTFDTNDRLASQTSFSVPPGHSIADGQTVVISDGLRTVTYEFNDLSLNNGVRAGSVAVGYQTSDSDFVIARRLRDIINAPQSQALLKVTAGLSDGVASGTTSSSARINLYGNATVSLTGSATVVNQPVAEPSDTLAQAIVTGIGTGSVVRYTGTGAIGDNAALPTPSTDVDLFSVALGAGDVLSIDVTADLQVGFFNGLLRVFDANGVELDFNDNTLTSFNPHLDFTAPSQGTYFVGVSGSFNRFYNPQVAGSGIAFGGTISTGSYTVTMSLPSASFALTEYDDVGDRNVTRDQGQILIEASSISQSSGFGILADASVRDAANAGPHPGSARLTREVNVANLAPGVAIANNILFRNAAGGVSFSGDTNVGPNNVALPRAVVPFGRIFNNTIVGRGTQDVGIQVGENASPTLLNNILSNLGTGISVHATSATTVVGGTVYHRTNTRTVGTGVGSFPLDIPNDGPLFVDALLDNYYLAPGSLAIDSSVNSVQDRPDLLAIKTPLGMAPSPILAPEYDALGQARVDDPAVNTPTGLGGAVFKDRGALDRADFTGPSATMLVPTDNDQQGKDLNRQATFIQLTNEILTNFSIQLLDGVAPTDPRQGTGADDTTVTADRVSIFRDGEKLIEGLDYRFHYDATNNIIRLTPLAGIWETDRVYEIQLSNSTGTSIQAPSGASVTDGNSFQLTDVSGNQVTFEYDSGYVLQVPQTLALQIPATGGASIADGERFVVSDGAKSVTFEFDSNGANSNNSPNPPSPPFTIISFAATDSANDIANKIVAALNAAQLGLAPANIVNAGGRAVHLGSRSIHQLDTTLTSLQQTGQAGGIENGQTFTIDDGTKVTTFALVTGTAGPGVRAVPFTLSQTNEQIADAIVAAIRAAGIGLNPTHQANSDGLIHLGGGLRHLVNTAASALVLTGSPGVQPAWSVRIPTIAGKPDLSLIADGQTFSITLGTTAAVFEFDSNGSVTAGNRAIAFSAQTTTDQLANAIALAIRNAGVGLSPTNAGNGIVTLGGTTGHVGDFSLSALTQLGSPGIAASEAVTFVPGDFFTPGIPVRTPIFSNAEMAQSIANAINLAKARSRLSSSVTVVVRDAEVITDGIATVSGIASVVTSNIRDVAGNSLKPNRNDGTTAFTVFVASGLDYGDAPAPYPTTEAANGARHQLVGDLFLGATADVDVDGQPSADGLGDDLQNVDDEDGVVVTQAFTGGYGGSVTVTASAAGFLDAWVDFNLDGDWNDAGEQIFASRPLQQGANHFTVAVPGTALPGLSFGRFRFSSQGGLAPTGLAEDGEVEDHAIQVQGNPWRNPNNGLDVDNSGRVVPLDALIIINELNRNGPHALPNPPVSPVPPPYLDPNGDTFVTPLDVLAIVNFLNSGAGEGESGSTGQLPPLGEGEGAAAAMIVEDAPASTAWVATPLLWSPWQAFATTTLVDHRLAAGGAADEQAAEVEEPSLDEDTMVADIAAASGPATAEWTELDGLGGDDLDNLLDGLAGDILNARA